jgi:hypothetical protein
MIRMGGARQRFCRSFHKQGADRPPLGPNLGHPELGCSFAGDHHEIHAPREELRERSKALPAEPLDAVPEHRAAHAFRDHDAQSRGTGRRRLSCHEKGEVPRPHAPAGALRTHELAVLA